MKSIAPIAVASAAVKRVHAQEELSVRALGPVPS